MSRLPGADPDFVIGRMLGGMPVVSLDDIREELGIRPEDGPTKVVYRAKDVAKDLMRSRTGFVFNATSLTRKLRKEWTEFFMTYNSRVRVVHVEAPIAEILKRNQTRNRTVPVGVIDKMMDDWQVPGFEEAYEVSWLPN